MSAESSGGVVRAPIEVVSTEIQELKDLVQEITEARSAVREIEASKPRRSKIPETGSAPIRTEAFESRGGIFGGETGKEEKFRDRSSRAAVQKENQFTKMRDQVQEMQEQQSTMMNSLINLGFTGGIGAGLSGSTQQKLQTGAATIKSTAKGGFLGRFAGLGGVKGMLAFGGIYGMIALAAMEVGQAIIDMMVAPGGILDRRFKRDISKEEVKMFDLREKEEISQGRRIIRVTTSSGLRGTSDQVRSNLDYYKQGKRIFDLDGTLITHQTGVGSV
jgi:hypothetical protein